MTYSEANNILIQLESVMAENKSILKRVKDIEYRLDHIIELPTEIDIRLHEVERKIEGLGNSYLKLKKEFQQKLEVDLEKWREYYSLLPSKNKKPHKCPPCDGSGIIWG